MNFTIQLAADGSHTIGSDASGNSVNIYLPDSAGGNATGIRPMQMLILGVGGCTAVDVLMILKKKRQVVEDFRIEMEASREDGKEPSLWEKIHLKYHFKGAIDPEKAKRAIEMSINTYCSASETLRKAGAGISWEAVVNGESV
jgi:putative redox protein